jgi:hypothetical protein
LATQIQIKRGSTTPAGLTVGESAMNTSTNQIYLGGTGGTVLVGGEVTGGVDMGAGSAVSANRIPTQSGVYNYVRNSTVTSFNGATGAVGGVTTSAANTFTELNSFNAGVSASALTVSGGVTFSGNVYLGDSATGVTAESNDYVMMMGGTGSAAFKSGFYQAYKVLTGSTTGVICVTPAFNANTTRGSTTLEITISYTQLVAGPVNQSSITHKFIMPLLFDQSDSLSVYDYTESITRASSLYSPVTFTFAASSNKIVISTTTTATAKFTSGWGFRTTVQVH